MPKLTVGIMLMGGIALHTFVVLALRHDIAVVPLLVALALSSALSLTLTLGGRVGLRPSVACTVASLGAILAVPRAPIASPPLDVVLATSGIVTEVVPDGGRTIVTLAEVEAGGFEIDRLNVSFDYLDAPLEVGAAIAFEAVLGRPRLPINPSTTPTEVAPLYGSARTTPVPSQRTASWSTTTALALRERLTFDSPSATALFRALILGDRSELDATTRYAYQDTGTAHLLAISGMNLALLGWGLFRILLFLFVRSARVPGLRAIGEPVLQGHRPRLAAAVVAFAMTAAYTSVIAPSDATDRALAALALTFAGIVLMRETSAWRTLCVCFFGAAVVSPEALLNAGFQLSFAATASLVLVAPHLRQVRAAMVDWPLRGLAFFVATLVIADLVCFLATAPLTVAWFGQLPAHSLWVNLVAIPFMTLLVFPAIVIWVVVATVVPPLGDLTRPLLTVIGDAFNDFIRVAGAASGTASTESWPLLVGVLATLALLALMTLRRWPVRVGMAALATATLAGFIHESPRPGLGLVALDVGHGDALALRLPDGTRVLIDTGGKGRVQSTRRDPNRTLAERTLVPALRAIGWSSIDLLVLSHADGDHTGAALALSERIPIRDVWLPPCARSGLTTLVTLLEARGTRVHDVARGPPFDYGGAHFELLWPPPDTEREDGCGLRDNEASLVMRVSYAGRRLLFTGDIEAGSEAELLTADVRADVLKVPHHGSRTSSTEAFLDAVAPSYAIVSGLPGKRPPPHPAVIERYAANHIPTLVTGTVGAVTVHVEPPLAGSPTAPGHLRIH